jgi:Bacterial Ig domain
MSGRGAVWIACKKPKIALLMIIFLLSASGSLATCGCKEKISESNSAVEKVDLKIQQQLNDEIISEKPAIVNVTPIIPHMRLKIIRPEYGEVFVGEKPTIALLAVTDTACAGDKCNGAYEEQREIRNVEFFEDSNFLGNAEKITDANADIVLWRYNWENVKQGTYTLTAKAIDCKNLTETSAPITITVKPPNESPRIVITSPYDGQIFSDKEPIPIIVHAWDTDDNVTKVEIFEGLNKIDENSTGCKEDDNCSFEFTWISPYPKIYSLKAVALDEEGTIGTSSHVTINVKPNQTESIAENKDLDHVSDSAECTFKFSPGNASLFSPYGEIGTTTPTFTWNSVPESTSYRLKVIDSMGEIYINKYYDLTNFDLECSDISCSVKPKLEEMEIKLVENKNYIWRIQTNNCFADGPWSPSMSFEITDKLPDVGKPYPISPNGLISTNTPTFIWSCLPGSYKYELQVKNEANKLIIDEEFDAEAVASGYNCSAISPVPLSNNGIFFWRIKAMGKDVGDESNFSPWMYFESVCAVPKDSANQIKEYINNLSDQAFDKNSDRRKSRLIDTLDGVKQRIDTRDYQRAIYRLDDIVRKRADGSIDGNRDDDWIVDPESQRKICGMIDDLIDNLEMAKETT